MCCVECVICLRYVYSFNFGLKKHSRSSCTIKLYKLRVHVAGEMTFGVHETLGFMRGE